MDRVTTTTISTSSLFVLFVKRNLERIYEELGDPDIRFTSLPDEGTKYLQVQIAHPVSVSVDWIRMLLLNLYAECEYEEAISSAVLQGSCESCLTIELDETAYIIAHHFKHWLVTLSGIKDVVFHLAGTVTLYGDSDAVAEADHLLEKLCEKYTPKRTTWSQKEETRGLQGITVPYSFANQQSDESPLRSPDGGEPSLMADIDCYSPRMVHNNQRLPLQDSMVNSSSDPRRTPPFSPRKPLLTNPMNMNQMNMNPMVQAALHVPPPPASPRVNREEAHNDFESMLHRHTQQQHGHFPMTSMPPPTPTSPMKQMFGPSGGPLNPSAPSFTPNQHNNQLHGPPPPPPQHPLNLNSLSSNSNPHVSHSNYSMRSNFSNITSSQCDSIGRALGQQVPAFANSSPFCGPGGDLLSPGAQYQQRNGQMAKDGLWVKGVDAPRLIGTRGSNKKRLEQMTGCTLVLHTESRHDGYFPIDIYGPSAHSCQNAKATIERFLASGASVMSSEEMACAMRKREPPKMMLQLSPRKNRAEKA